jgi:hypothetical protein
MKTRRIVATISLSEIVHKSWLNNLGLGRTETRKLSLFQSFQQFHRFASFKTGISPFQTFQIACPESYRRVQSLCSVQNVLGIPETSLTLRNTKCRARIVVFYAATFGTSLSPSSDKFQSFQPFNRFAPFKPGDQEHGAKCEGQSAGSSERGANG